jgi:Lon protease-like protein
LKKKEGKILSKIAIFPLPNVVFFPKTLLPLHIFEGRYRKMVEDVLPGSNQIGMVLLKDGWETNYFGNPDVHEIVCIGDIQYFEKLDDGKFNIMLYGISKAKIVAFIQEQPYRIAQVKFLQDVRFDRDTFNERIETETLLRLVHDYLAELGAKNMDGILNADTQSFEALINQVAFLLDFSAQEKQRLLEMDSLALRYEKVKELMKNRLTSLRVAKNIRFAPKNPQWN